MNEWKARCPIAAKLIIMIYLINFFSSLYSLWSHINRHTHTLSLHVSTYLAGLRDRTAVIPSIPALHILSETWSDYPDERQDTYYAPVCGNYRQNLTVCVFVRERDELHVINLEWRKESYYLKKLCKMCLGGLCKGGGLVVAATASALIG